MIARLDQFFFNTADQCPDDPALSVDDITLSYSELAVEAKRVSAHLITRDRLSSSCLLFASRSVAAYAGLLGILHAGMAYVPLNPRFPAARNAAIVRRSGSRTVLVDRHCRDKLDDLLALLDEPLDIVFLDEPLPPEDFPVKPFAPVDQDLAYILFTSGTTGPPKGVCIRHDSAVAYVQSQLKFDPPMPGARYSQNFELTFDPSIQDLFICWANGGWLHVPESLDPLYLVDFIKQHRITHWGSVPSIAALMRQLRKLSDNAFPSLRVSLFSGEALSLELVRAWARAASASRIVNVYGPTETTVACLRFELTPAFLRDTDLAIAPLGDTWEGMETRVVDENGDPVQPGHYGELVVGGRQLAKHYMTDNELDHRKFYARHYEGSKIGRWYRTGDVVVHSPLHGLMFRGRTDHQIKLLGNRIELLEVEEAVKHCSRAAASCVVAWPRSAAGTPQGLVAFVLNPEVPEKTALTDCKRRLPLYAVPSRTVALDRFPLNANGKVDRNQLVALLDPATQGVLT